LTFVVVGGGTFLHHLWLIARVMAAMYMQRHWSVPFLCLVLSLVVVPSVTALSDPPLIKPRQQSLLELDNAADKPKIPAALKAELARIRKTRSESKVAAEVSQSDASASVSESATSESTDAEVSFHQRSRSIAASC